MKKPMVIKIVGKKYSWQKESENQDWIKTNTGKFFEATFKNGKYKVVDNNAEILINTDQAIAIS